MAANLAKDSQNLGLTNVSEYANVRLVKSQLLGLLDRLKMATERRGMKSALAKYLGVPLASVSQWLSGDREPGGETTLKMLRWVQEQESQPNTLGSASNTTKGNATQVRSSKVYEKPKPSPKKQ